MSAVNKRFVFIVNVVWVPFMRRSNMRPLCVVYFCMNTFDLLLLELLHLNTFAPSITFFPFFMQLVQYYASEFIIL